MADKTRTAHAKARTLARREERRVKRQLRAAAPVPAFTKAGAR